MPFTFIELSISTFSKVNKFSELKINIWGELQFEGNLPCHNTTCCAYHSQGDTPIVEYIDLINRNLDLSPNPDSFILIMRKENKCLGELKKSPFLSVLNENNIYIAFKKQFRNL